MFLDSVDILIKVSKLPKEQQILFFIFLIIAGIIASFIAAYLHNILFEDHSKEGKKNE